MPIKKRSGNIWLIALAGCLLQFLLFASLYFTRIDEGHFFYNFKSFPGSLVSRSNPDFFRWCLEYAFCFCVFLYLVKATKSKLWIILISIIYLVLTVFQIYYFTLWKIYGEIPIFSYDWALFLRVLPIFVRTMGINPNFIYLIILLSILIIFSMVYFIHLEIAKRTISLQVKTIFGFSFFFFLVPLLLKSIIPQAPESNQTKSAIVWVAQNMVQTFTRDRIKTLGDTINTNNYREYFKHNLKTKPNILLIFIEAYGSVIGSTSPYNKEYIDQLNQIQEHLSAHHWKSVSALSNSTILGGRSWLGFTSLISGIRIDNHPAYEKLISDHQDYPHFISLLNKNNYHTYRLNTMANFGDDFKELDEKAGNYFQCSTWTRYNNLPYQGYRYDYFGGIPDQYALNYWDEQVLNKKQEPYFLFFITLNTHAPFYLPPPLVENWKDLDAIQKSPHQSVRSESPKPMERYSQEVHYILSVLEKYILEKADSNTMIILVGDHQPAGMEYQLNNKTDLYACPMHIITKDSAWENILVKKGFEKGMVPLFKPGSLLKHEGFYSFLMSAWAERDSLPVEYKVFPNGIAY